MLALLVAAASFAASPSVTTRTVEHLGDRYTVVTVGLGAEADVRLYGGLAGGISFEEARRQAEKEGRSVLMSTNAGMYGPDDGPVGFFVRLGERRHEITLAEGEGNFYLKPNGVFWTDAAGAHVDVSDQVPLDRADAMTLATQSGPMLLVDGAIHPAFRADSPNRLSRSGVGVSADGKTVHFVLSEGGVRFHDVATLLRDVLACDDALFLDGVVSRMWTGAGEMPSARFGGVLSATVPAPPP